MAQETKQVQESIIVAPKVYENPEIGMHLCTITRVEDLGMVKSDLYGEQHKVKIHVRVDDEKDSKGQPMFVGQTSSLSLGKKSRLGTFLRQLGIPTDGEFDLAELVGMKINANIVHNKSGDTTYANIESVGRIRSKKTAVTEVVEEETTEV
jgi:hypothetical protein